MCPFRASGGVADASWGLAGAVLEAAAGGPNWDVLGSAAGEDATEAAACLTDAAAAAAVPAAVAATAMMVGAGAAETGGAAGAGGGPAVRWEEGAPCEGVAVMVTGGPCY